MIAPRAKVAALQRSIASTVKQRILTFDLNMAGLAGYFTTDGFSVANIARQVKLD